MICSAASLLQWLLIVHAAGRTVWQEMRREVQTLREVWSLSPQANCFGLDSVHKTQQVLRQNTSFPNHARSSCSSRRGQLRASCVAAVHGHMESAPHTYARMQRSDPHCSLPPHSFYLARRSACSFRSCNRHPEYPKKEDGLLYCVSHQNRKRTLTCPT